GADDRDALPIRRPRLDDVLGQGEAVVAEEPLDAADADRLVVLAAVAGLLAGVVADAPGDRGEGHVLFDQRVGVAVAPLLDQVEVGLDFLAGRAGVVAGRELVLVDRPDVAPVAGRKERLAETLVRSGRHPRERDLQVLGDSRAPGRHSMPLLSKLSAVSLA